MSNPQVLAIPVITILIALGLFHSFTPALAQVYSDEYDLEEEYQPKYYDDEYDEDYDENYGHQNDSEIEYTNYDQSSDESDFVDVGTAPVSSNSSKHGRGHKCKSFKPKKWTLIVGLILLPILILYYIISA
ncbi:hypothetical protein [Methanopyrus sp. KOL6]|uniref:hypothetical protein n=1 Tax=Methanopyrus sp. KOL6 TaxID=1937004 RepID=UPI000B4AD9AB|nr:hypothetical protein [Methanopyrus sp. KOL6]